MRFMRALRRARGGNGLVPGFDFARRARAIRRTNAALAAPDIFRFRRSPPTFAEPRTVFRLRDPPAGFMYTMGIATPGPR